MRRLALFVTIALAVPVVSTSAVLAKQTVVAPTASAVTASAVTADADWIMQAQLPDGGIAHHVDRVAIAPYLANYAAVGLARARQVTGDTGYGTAAWRWLQWYQAHEDANGFVTDYAVSGAAETSTGSMDSTDAYAGTFLVAARAAWQATSDLNALRQLAPGITGAVGAIEKTQDSDGLTWAKPTWKVKYLMDQAEAYAGLQAAADMAAATGNRVLSKRASADAQRLSQGVNGLWNSATGAYDWAKHENGARQTTNWSVLYPDSLEQTWAVAFGLATGSRAQAVMAQFSQHQLTWDTPTATARFDTGPQLVGYWSVAAWAYGRTGQTARATQAATSIRAAALNAGRAWPFTTGDAGELVTLESAGWTALP